MLYLIDVILPMLYSLEFMKLTLGQTYYQRMAFQLTFFFTVFNLVYHPILSAFKVNANCIIEVHRQLPFFYLAEAFPLFWAKLS